MSDVTEKVIPFETVRVPNGDKPKGYEEVISDGVDGKTITTKNSDGQLVSEKTTPAKNQVIYFGTKEDGEDGDTLSSGTAGDKTISQSVEPVSTPDSSQEQTSKDTPEKSETDEDSFVPPLTGYFNHSQGRFTKTKEIFGMNVTTLKKAALEAGRLLVLAIPGILIAVLTDNPELGGTLGATILLVLKSLDRGIHEDKSTASTGILPF